MRTEVWYVLAGILSTGSPPNCASSFLDLLNCKYPTLGDSIEHNIQFGLELTQFRISYTEHDVSACFVFEVNNGL